MSVRIPKTKRDIVDRILSIDFSGDVRKLDTDPDKVRLQRVRANAFELVFSNGQKFVFSVSKPRTEEALEAMRAKKEAADVIDADEVAPAASRGKLRAVPAAAPQPQLAASASKRAASRRSPA